MIIQLLGLCPFLTISFTATNALVLGLTMTLILFFTNITVSIFRHSIPSEIRIPIYLMIISSVVSVVQILINTYTFDLSQYLGIFIPLTITNCIIIGRAEVYASKNNIYNSAIDGFLTGARITILLFFIGATREILGTGTLFSGADLLLGEWAKILYIKVINLNSPFLFAIFPPGAFIVLGLILACKYLIDKRGKINL